MYEEDAMTIKEALIEARRCREKAAVAYHWETRAALLRYAATFKKYARLLSDSDKLQSIPK